MIQLLIVVCLALSRIVESHRPLTVNGAAHCGTAFGTLETALFVPEITTSWATNRVFTCSAQTAWFTFDIKEKTFPLYVGAGVPEVARFSDMRMKAAVIGPGLPAPPADFPLIDQVPAGMGVIYVESAQDQSTCAHLTNSQMKSSTDVKDGRCHFYEHYGKTDSWVVLDQNLQLAETGRHYVVFWPSKKMSGKAWLSVSDHRMKEEFAIQYDLPAVGCSCVSSANAFYEKSPDDLKDPDGKMCMDGMEMSTCKATGCTKGTCMEAMDMDMDMGGNNGKAMKQVAHGHWDLVATCSAMNTIGDMKAFHLMDTSVEVMVDRRADAEVGTLVIAKGMLMADGAMVKMTSHMGHLHGKACNTKNGGAHWMHNLSLPYNAASNELHIMGTTDAMGMFDVAVTKPWRVDHGEAGELPDDKGSQQDRPLSMVFHDARPGKDMVRAGCCDLEWLPAAQETANASSDSSSSSNDVSVGVMVGVALAALVVGVGGGIGGAILAMQTDAATVSQEPQNAMDSVGKPDINAAAAADSQFRACESVRVC